MEHIFSRFFFLVSSDKTFTGLDYEQYVVSLIKNRHSLPFPGILFVFVMCLVASTLHVSIDCTFLIVSSVSFLWCLFTIRRSPFSDVYLQSDVFLSLFVYLQTDVFPSLMFIYNHTFTLLWCLFTIRQKYGSNLPKLWMYFIDTTTNAPTTIVRTTRAATTTSPTTFSCWDSGVQYPGGAVITRNDNCATCVCTWEKYHILPGWKCTNTSCPMLRCLYTRKIEGTCCEVCAGIRFSCSHL